MAPDNRCALVVLFKRKRHQRRPPVEERRLPWVRIAVLQFRAGQTRACARCRPAGRSTGSGRRLGRVVAGRRPAIGAWRLLRADQRRRHRRVAQGRRPRLRLAGAARRTSPTTASQVTSTSPCSCSARGRHHTAPASARACPTPTWPRRRATMTTCGGACGYTATLSTTSTSIRIPAVTRSWTESLGL